MPSLVPGPRPQPAPRPLASFRASLAGLLLAGGLAGVVLPPPIARAHETSASENGLVYKSKPGPWGDLEYSRIMIEPPEEFMAPDYSAQAPSWHFAGYDVESLDRLLRDASLDETQLRTLSDPSLRTVTPAGITLRPPDTVVRNLSPESRAALYAVLARLPGNALQKEPFRFRADMLDEWFEDSGVDAAIVAQVRSLLYPRGNSLLFSDPHLILPLLPTPAERVRLIKTLARKSSLLVKIRVTPSSDIETIAAYWSAGRRRKDVRPLLHSLARHRGGMTLDLAHLLPRFARGLLYTYPSPEVPLEQSPDCHWTSMNFFNDPPEPRFGDIAYLRQTILTSYVAVTTPPAMGDLLLLTEPDGEVIHSCIYIADDIVFTKNGQSASVPWTLTTLPDLQASYPSQNELQIRVFRMKN